MWKISHFSDAEANMPNRESLVYQYSPGRQSAKVTKHNNKAKVSYTAWQLPKPSLCPIMLCPTRSVLCYPILWDYTHWQMWLLQTTRDLPMTTPGITWLGLGLEVRGVNHVTLGIAIFFGWTTVEVFETCLSVTWVLQTDRILSESLQDLNRKCIL